MPQFLISAAGARLLPPIDYRPLRPAAVLAALAAIAALLAFLPLPWAVLLALGSAGAIIVLRRPWTVWLLPAATLPVAGSFRLGPVTAIEVLLGLAALVWLLSGAARRRLRIFHHPLLAPLLVYVGLLALSLWRAPNLGEAAKEMVKWVEFAVVLCLLPAMTARPGAKWLVAALLAAAVGQALLGLYQFIFQIGPDWFVVLGRFMRASGSFRQPNPFAGYLGLTLPVAAALSLWGIQTLATRSRTPSVVAWAAVYVPATVIIAAGLLASWSRGAWLGALVAATVVLLAYSRRTALWVAMAALALLIAALLGALNPTWIPAAVSARLQDLPAYFGLTNVLDQPVTDENFAVLERLAHWVAALRMFALAPWLGVGPGNYETLYPLVRLPIWEEPLGHAHNIYLNVLAETGLVGLAGFLLFWGSAAAWVWRSARRTAQITLHDSWRQALAAGILGVLAHLAVHSVFDNLFVQGIYLHLAFWLAAPAAAQAPAAAGDNESEVAIC
ncbi:MAG: O-antigen ligase family protein [Caldilineaceae bacterium]|nr:O-antigen ligase family protein [Caldilineaceae bacterium]